MKPADSVVELPCQASQFSGWHSRKRRAEGRQRAAVVTSIGPGALQALGTALRPIRLSAYSQSPQRGMWTGLNLSGGTNGNGSESDGRSRLDPIGFLSSVADRLVPDLSEPTNG